MRVCACHSSPPERAHTHTHTHRVFKRCAQRTQRFVWPFTESQQLAPRLSLFNKLAEQNQQKLSLIITQTNALQLYESAGNTINAHVNSCYFRVGCLLDCCSVSFVVLFQREKCNWTRWRVDHSTGISGDQVTTLLCFIESKHLYTSRLFSGISRSMLSSA